MLGRQFPIYYSIPEEEARKNFSGQVAISATIGVMVPISPWQSIQLDSLDPFLGL